MNETNKMNYAPPALRLLAHVIDLLVSMVLFSFALLYISSESTLTSLLDSTLFMLFFLLIVLGLIWSFLLPLMESYFGGSPGKLITGLRLVDQDARYISFERALFRDLVGRIVSGSFFGLGYYWIIRDQKRQSWHDMTVDTYVIRKQKNLWLLGIVTSILLIVLLAFMASATINNFTMNIDVYRQIISFS